MDNDCDAQIDEGVTLTFYLDSDNDNQGNNAVTTGACSAPTGYTGNNWDCNDANNQIYSGAAEICNGYDDDCDLLIDENFATTAYYPDSDTDTYGDLYSDSQQTFSA